MHEWPFGFSCNPTPPYSTICWPKDSSQSCLIQGLSKKNAQAGLGAFQPFLIRDYGSLSLSILLERQSCRFGGICLRLTFMVSLCRVHRCICMRENPNANRCLCICIYAYLYIYIHMYTKIICTYVDVYICKDLYTHTHMYI